MAESQMTVASAVLVPEAVEQPSPSDGAAKRRQSSVSEDSKKRIRLEQGQSYIEQEIDSGLSGPQNQLSERRRSGQMEERKRGQRLFGALLGTLSQSSSSAAQKRRVDIEKKQQAKLKLQAEEYDEKKKQQMEAVMQIRRREQKKYDKQSMQIRHSNLLAAAQFLQTRAEPRLYYKPWEPLPGDDAKIKSQVVEAEDTIEKESSKLEFHQLEELRETSHGIQQTTIKPDDSLNRALETVGPSANPTEPINPSESNDTNLDPLPAADGSIMPAVVHETSKDHTDDGGEVVLEADEDTVIY